MPMTKPTDSNRGFFLRERRQERGVTQEELAHACGTSKGMISQIETGYQRYNEDWIRKLSDALQIPRVALFLAGGVEEAEAGSDPRLADISAAWPKLSEDQKETLHRMISFLRPGR